MVLLCYSMPQDTQENHQGELEESTYMNVKEKKLSAIPAGAGFGEGARRSTGAASHVDVEAAEVIYMNTEEARKVSYSICYVHVCIVVLWG